MQTTQWYVITGAPCAGKTTLIKALAQLGYAVVHEVARAYLMQQRAQGLDLAAVKSDLANFEREILYRKAAIESKLPCEQLIFLDRALPDSTAYFKAAGLDISETLTYVQRFRYQGIFLLERVPCTKDAVRTEDDAMAATLEQLLQETYRDLGYSPVHVPLLRLTDRVLFVLKHVQKGL